MAAILTFARAVFWGLMLGGGLLMLLTVPLAIIYFDWARPVDSLWIALMPFVLAASIGALLPIGFGFYLDPGASVSSFRFPAHWPDR